MRDLSALPQTPDVIEKQAEQRTGRRHLGQIRLRPGMTLFEYNPTSGEVKAVATARQARLNGTGVEFRSEMQVKLDCYYVQALNLKNAKRKFGIK